MRKLFYILVLGMILSSCAAEKRLARFLATHPELKHIDTIYIHDTVIKPEETTTITVTLQDILAIDSVATAAPETEDSPYTKYSPSTSIGIESDRAGAALTAKGDGKFVLSSTAKKDTVFLDKTIEVPSYVTQIEYKDKEVYKMTLFQQIIFGFGIISAIIAIILTIIIVIKLFLKL